mgnify:CR=1 FL=1
MKQPQFKQIAVTSSYYQLQQLGFLRAAEIDIFRS